MSKITFNPYYKSDNIPALFYVCTIFVYVVHSREKCDAILERLKKHPSTTVI